MVPALKAQAEERQLKDFISDLSTMVDSLQNFCPICWAWDKRCIPAHKLFVACRAEMKIQNPIPFASNWMKFKKSLQGQWKQPYLRPSCYGCGLPTQELEPAAHKPLIAGRDCAFGDFIALSLWVVINVPKLRQQLITHFNIPAAIHSQEKLISWFTTKEPNARMANYILAWHWLGRRQCVWLVSPP